jgi:hypothetical protein
MAPVRPEISGELLGNWRFMLAGDWGATAADNPAGTNETQAAAPGAAPTATSGRYASAQTPAVRAAPTDITMENRTSDKFLPFMERSLAVRALGIPTNKELGVMFWGEDEKKLFFYSAGIFNGEGQNRPNMDNRFDAMARVFVHPLATVNKDWKDLQIGGSARWGVRDHDYVDYDYPGMTTQSGFAFWSPVYGGPKGRTHILPSGTQRGFAGELRIPIDRFDVTSEFVYVKNDTRESVEGFQASLTNVERLGEMKGYSYYVMAGFWVFGKRGVNGLPGYQNPAHVDFSKPDAPPAPNTLQILVKWEQLRVKYSGESRKEDASSAYLTRNADGDIKVNALSLGVNYWLTKHVRLSANYVLDMFPDSAPAATTTGTPQSEKQRAVAPGNTIAQGVDNPAREQGPSAPRARVQSRRRVLRAAAGSPCFLRGARAVALRA